MNTAELREPLDVIRKLQDRNRRIIRKPQPDDRIAFAFNSKDRYHSTLHTIASIDTDAGFDIIWNDSSADPRIAALAQNRNFQNAKLVEFHSRLHDDADALIQFGLRRLLDLGYDYIGLIENSIAFEPGWFARLIELFSCAAGDGLVCGAASVRGYESRMLEYRDGYSINWASGAGMILFSRRAAELIHAHYPKLSMSMAGVRDFYGDLFGLRLRTGESDENPAEMQDTRCGTDLGYSPFLYTLGFATLGAIPSMAFDLESSIPKRRHPRYVAEERNNAGIAHPRLGRLISVG